MTTRNTIPLLILFALLTALAGCGSVTASNQDGAIPTAISAADTETDVKTVSAEVPAQDGMITVADTLGRTVTVPKRPDRVAAIFAPANHIICMLGDSEKVVAFSEGNLRDALFVELYPSLLNARTPHSSRGLNIEELFVDPVPQVIFCNSGVVMDDRVLEMLERFGVPIVALEFDSTESLKYAVALIGEIMGREAEARIYNDYLDWAYGFVKERTAGIPEDGKKVVYHAINELLRTEIVNTLPGEWIPELGIVQPGVVELEGANDRKHYLTLEELFVYDPEYIIINGEDVYEYIQISERLHSLSAFKNDKIFLLPVGITRFTHPYSIETPIAMLWLGKTIYPDLFEDIDMHEEVRAFYQEVFRADLSDATIEAVLSGRGLRNTAHAGRAD